MRGPVSIKDAHMVLVADHYSGPYRSPYSAPYPSGLLTLARVLSRPRLAGGSPSGRCYGPLFLNRVLELAFFEGACNFVGGACKFMCDL